MATTTLTSDNAKKNKSMFREGEVIISGITRFNNLKTPRGGKLPSGGEMAPAYDITLAFDPEGETAQMLQALHDKAIAAERSELTPIKGKSIIDRPLNMKDDVDANGKPTGLARMSFRRKETAGAPVLVDHNAEPLNVPFIPSGTPVDVQVTVYSYNTAGAIGLAMSLEAVQTVEPFDLPERNSTIKVAFKPKGTSSDPSKDFGI